ncbi:MAG: hypothetical protein HQL69_17875 [Magnetococcales bacterium]|nr:hypothetical protein [Magnetococcales bacterium]
MKAGSLAAWINRYPNTTLFRQDLPNSWNDVMSRVKQALIKRVQEK